MCNNTKKYGNSGETQFYLFTNGTHSTVIAARDIVTPGQYDAASEVSAALSMASERFRKAGLDATAIDYEEIDADEIDDVDEVLTPTMKLIVARGVCAASLAVEMELVDDLQLDLSLQALDIFQALDYLADEDVRPIERGEWPKPALDAGEHDEVAVAEQRLADLTSRCLELDAHLTDGLFTSEPENAAAVAKVKKLMQLVRDVASGGVNKLANPVLREVLRTQEVEDGVADHLSDEQKLPWNVEVEMFGDSLRLETWPANVNKDDADRGLGVLFWVKEGRPVLSIGPSPMAEHSMHVISLGPDLIEVTPDTGRSAPRAPSQVYDGVTATIFQNR